MPRPRRDVLAAIGAKLTAAFSSNLLSFLSQDLPHDVHAIGSEGVRAHG
jgi:hypothetical protein